jgi:rhamnosyltransferase
MCYNELSAAGYKIGLVGVQDYDKITNEMNKARLKKGKELINGYYDIDNTLSSGSLISREAYLAIGGMRDDLFIDAVDHEYCWRLKKSGFKVIRNKNALLGHRLGDGKFKILNLVYVGMPSPFRHYYATRNIFLLFRDSHVPLYWKLSSVVKLIGKIIFYPLFMPDGKDRMKFFLKGIFDGIANRNGRMK